MSKIKIRKVTPSVAYPSSLIQQSSKESIDGHGLIVWNLDDYTYDFVDIKNDFGYYTFHVENGEILNWDDDLIPPKIRAQIYYHNTALADRKIIESFIRSKRKVTEWKIQIVKGKHEFEKLSKHAFNLNIRDIEYQNALIEDFLKEQNLPQSTIENLKIVNKELNLKLISNTQEKVIRNSSWKPLTFEFSNMFSYGEKNFIDFSNMEGVYGIFGANATGKSTVFDAFCFCLFDKCSKTYKAKDVLNYKKSDFSSKVTLQIDEIIYTVEKKGKKTANGNVKVDIDFYYFGENGDKISLNGDQRDSTTKSIRNFIGSYEDFILTCLSVQNNGTNFIERPQRERRELLINFLDIGIFDELNVLASDTLREIKVIIKSLQNLNLDEKLQRAVTNYEKLNNAKIESEQTLNNEKQNLNIKEYEKEKLLKSLKTIEKLPDLESTQKMLQEKQSELLKIESKILQNEQDQTWTDKLNGVTLQLQDLDSMEQLQKNVNFLKQIQQLKNDLSTQLQVGNAKIKNAQDHIDKLSTHEYDPSCQFCIKHPTVQQGNDAYLLLQVLLEEKTILESKVKRTEQEIEIYQDSPQNLQYYQKILQQKNQYEKELLIKEKSLESLIKDKSLCESKIEELNLTVNKILTSKNLIDENKKIESALRVLDTEIAQLKKDIENQQSVLLRINSDISVNLALIKDCEDNFTRLKNLAEEQEIYSAYSQCVKSDGIPYRIIDKIVPALQEEINNILEGIVDFKVVFEMDSKNINVYISYEDGSHWPIEAGSGMEKFISSLAIRTALIGCTSLPKPNFICIDEGFGVLDADNLTSVQILFQKMKENFDTLFCISHIDEMKDIVDKFIYITKQKGHSQIFVN